MTNLTITNSILLNAEALPNATGSSPPLDLFKITTTDIAIFWTQLITDVIFAITVVILALQILLQRKEMSANGYAELRQHHHDLITALFEYPDALAIYDHELLPANYPDDFNKIVLHDKEKIIFDVYMA